MGGVYWCHGHHVIFAGNLFAPLLGHMRGWGVYWRHGHHVGVNCCYFTMYQNIASAVLPDFMVQLKTFGIKIGHGRPCDRSFLAIFDMYLALEGLR